MGDDEYRPEVNNSSSAHGIQINNIGRTSIILLACFAGLSLGVSLGALFFMMAQNSILREQMITQTTEVKLLEYYLLELDQEVTAAGIQKPANSVASKLRAKRTSVE